MMEARLLASDNKPLRQVEEDGALTLHSSMEVLMQWLPNMSHDLLTVWSKMPVFRVLCYQDRFTYQNANRSYLEHEWPDGEDLGTAICWWRKRVNSSGRGFAVFEGGFDISGAVVRTEAPVCLVDAATGEVEADGGEEVARKRLLHNKRQNMDAKWMSKGLSDEARLKINAAEARIRERKERGEGFLLRAGWTPRSRVGEAEAAKHNDVQKWAISQGH